MMRIEYSNKGETAEFELVVGDQRVPLKDFRVQNVIEEVEDAEDERIVHQRVVDTTVTMVADWRQVQLVDLDAE